MKLSLEAHGYVTRSFEEKSPLFIAACKTVPPPWGKKGETLITSGIPPTKRQASKWLRGKGIAYKVYRGRV